jgi:hypothetical protein
MWMMEFGSAVPKLVQLNAALFSFIFLPLLLTLTLSSFVSPLMGVEKGRML